MKTIGFIGGGKMGEAIFSGLIRTGACSAGDIAVSCRTNEKCSVLEQKYPGVRTFNTSGEEGVAAITEASDVLVLAVHPDQGRDILMQMEKYLDPARHLVVSIMAGVTTEFMEQFVTKTPVVRVMPNTPLSVGEGVAGICGGKNASAEDVETVASMFSRLGLAVVLPEKNIEALTGVSGCGPAFCAQFLCGLADAGVALGLTRDVAIRIAAQTLAGTGKMVLEGNVHPEVLKDGVCSPGGSTIAGCIYLDQHSVRGIAAGAVQTAVNRVKAVAEDA
ncbi:MAG: pyrroline-5-carboxylate reductase [Firmicutes bacterium]|nr:pyrroline-5-carboxylate reductase [Bacillota bacterium]